MSPTSAAALEFDDMAVIHRIFRRGVPMVTDLVRRTPDGATARSEPIAAHAEFLLNALHNHHSTEDELVWPLLLERAAPQAEMISRMERQHEVVAERSERVRALLDVWRTAPTDGEVLATVLDEFTAALVEHLDDEEANVVPLIRAHITADEWERFGQEAFEKFTNDEKLIATGVLEDVATPAEAAWFMQGLPLPIRLMWRLVGRRKYTRYITGVRGNPRPGPVLGRLFRYGNRLAVTLYRRSGGRIGGSAKGIPVLLITVPGRRTGTPHTVPVVYIEHEGGYIVTGSAGGTKSEPQWFRNLRPARHAHIELRGRHHDVDVRVPSRAERDQLWRDVVLAHAPFFEKYEQKAGRVIPVAVLTPRPAAHQPDDAKHPGTSKTRH